MNIYNLPSIPPGYKDLMAIFDGFCDSISSFNQSDLDNILLLDTPEKALQYFSMLSDFKYFPNIGLLPSELSCSLADIFEAIVYIGTKKEVTSVEPVNVFKQVDIYLETKILTYVAKLLHPYKEGNLEKNEVYFTFKGLIEFKKKKNNKHKSYQTLLKSSLLEDYYNQLKQEIEKTIQEYQYEGTYNSFLNALLAVSDYDNFVRVQKLFFPIFLHYITVKGESKNRPMRDRKLGVLIPLFETIAPEWNLADIADSDLAESGYNSQYDRKIHIIKSKLR